MFKEKKKSILKYLFIGQLILLYLPTFTFFSIPTDNGTIPASACYFFSLLFVPFLLQKFWEKEIKLPPLHITGLAGYVIILALIRMGQYGISKGILHWLFGFYLLIVIINLGNWFTKEEWFCILEWAVITFAILHFILMIRNYEFVSLLCKNYFLGVWTGNEGCFLPSLTRGGRNLDATWLAMGSLFVRGKKKAPYITYVILFAFLGGSRVGIISAALVCLWTLLYEKGYKLCKMNIKWYIGYVCAMLVVLFCTGFAQATLSRMLIDIASPGELLYIAEEVEEEAEEVEEEAEEEAEKIVEINLGMEGGSTVVLSGRKDIWTRVPQMVADNPFGYGVGNAMRVMRNEYGFKSYEDVIHNVFMQLTVDEGIIGGLWYIFLVCLLLFRQWKKRPHFFEERLDCYLGIYIVLSLVQFHGGEALMIFALGVNFLMHDTKYLKIPNFLKRG